MNPINDGGPAFPTAQSQFHDGVVGGMTLRDYFAAHAPAMPSDLGALALEAADVDNPGKTHGEKSEVLLSIRAEWNYMYADAMLAARGGAS